MRRGRVSAARSRNMAAIKGKDTKPEMLVRRALHAAGFRYRLHGKKLPGKPDIVMPARRAVVFVHGCFWHHHGCANSVWPKVRELFWRTKIIGNMERDQRNRRELRDLGWQVFVIWECEVRKSFDPVARVIASLQHAPPPVRADHASAQRQRVAEVSPTRRA